MFNYPNIYEQQARNRRDTVIIMALFVLFFCFLGYGFDLFYFGIDPLGIVYEDAAGLPFATLGALLLGSASAAWGLQGGAMAVLQSADAFPVPEDEAEFQTVRNVVDEMAIASGLPRPELYIIPDPDPNAFATGKDPGHSYIAVTQGLVQKLNREELQGVIAHEMSHIKNYDIRLMTIVAALIGAIFLLADWGGRARRFGIGGRRRSLSRNAGPLGVILLVIWLLAVLLAPLISNLLAMAVSRRREYYADATGAELTRNPLALANALEVLNAASEPTTSIKKGSAHLCIVDPLGRKMNLKEGPVAELFGTHPPIEKRITLLKAMAYQMTPAMKSA